MTNTAVRENTTQDVVTLADVKSLVGAAAPCITLAMPIPQERVARLKGEFPVSLRKKLGWPISRRNIPRFTSFRRQACFDAVATALTVG
jgi:hypothetical protein